MLELRAMTGSMGLCQGLWWCPWPGYSQGSWESCSGCPRYQIAGPALCRLHQQESWPTPPGVYSPSGMGVEYLAPTFHGLGRTIPFDRLCNWTAGSNPHYVSWWAGPDGVSIGEVALTLDWTGWSQWSPGMVNSVTIQAHVPGFDGPPTYQLHPWHPETHEGTGPKELLPHDLHDLG